MKQIVAMVLAFAAGAVFSASVSAVEMASEAATRVVGSDVAGVLPVGSAVSAPPDDKLEEPPEERKGESGEEEIPEKPEDEGETGGGTPPGSGASDDTTVLTGVYQLDGGTAVLDGGDAGGALSSTTSDENVILVQSNAFLTVSHYALSKGGTYTNTEDNANFYAVNAVVAAKTAGRIYIDNSTLTSDVDGANGLFASGSNSTIYAYRCTIASEGDSSRGLDATYGGTVIAAEMSIDTSGSHCAALATDRGNGCISVTNASLATAGQGSPLIYSTGVIEVNCVTGTATGAQIAGIEGLSAIRIRNSVLSGSAEQASESVPNGVMIYQSGSGDYTEGTATFEVSDSSLTSSISGGALFYITHSAAIITVRNTVLEFDRAGNWLLNAAGNDGTNGWGTAGSNGGDAVFTAIDQTLAGNIAVDGISSVDLYLTNSTYTGTFVKDAANDGDGEINVFVSADSTWTVTSNCTLKCLTAADGAKIVDGSGNAVSIVGTNGTVHVSGTSDPKITVSSYVQGGFVATNITDFTISRAAFDAKYGASGSEEGGGQDEGTGGATDHDGWVYYCQPHPPDNAIVKVRVSDAEDYGTPDRDHKYRLDGYWDGNAETGVVVHLLYVTTEGYLFSDGCKSNTWDVTVTNNAQVIDPPGDVVAIKAQAKSGATYYLTLQEAVDAAKDRARITLNDNVTLNETLTVTNSITLDLDGTNVLTLASDLTNAFHFTAGGTVSNGTINSSLASNVDGSVLMRFTDCKARLRDLTVNGGGYETVVAHDADTSSKKYAMTCDGLILTGNGCLLSVDHATATLTNDCSFTLGGTLASFGDHAAAIYCTSNGTVSIVGGTYVAPTVLLADDYGAFFKSDDVAIAAPDGYVWESGRLVEATSDDLVTPGVASDPYDDAQAATNAAAAINADKAGSVAVPAGVEDSAAYYGIIEARVTSDNCVVFDLTSAAEVEVRGAIDEAVTNETVFASLVSTNASDVVTIATTTPGLYYWVLGGTDVGAVTEAGPAELSKTGGSVELTRPTLDATKGRAFFRVAAGVSAPAQWEGNK